MGDTIPYTGLSNGAWASLFAGIPSLSQMFGSNMPALPLTTDAPTASATVQQTPQQLLSQIPVWVWVALGGALLIVLTSKR